MRLRAIQVAAICCLAATLFAIPACTDGISRPEDHDYWNDGPRDITSPEAALLALKDAYREREVAELDSLLSEDFIFELSPGDASMPGMPDGWGRSGELAIYAQMFDADLVQSLAVDFVIGPRVFDQVEQLWSITITRVDLGLYGLTPDHPTPKMYRVENDSAKFWFRPMTWNARGTDDRAWKIVKWQDEFVEGARRRGLQSPPERGSNTTWGYIKSRYLPQP